MNQCHLPQLDGLGIIDYNKKRGIIRRGPEYAGVRAIQQTAGRVVTDEEGGEE